MIDYVEQVLPLCPWPTVHFSSTILLNLNINVHWVETTVHSLLLNGGQRRPSRQGAILVPNSHLVCGNGLLRCVNCDAVCIMVFTCVVLYAKMCERWEVYWGEGVKFMKFGVRHNERCTMADVCCLYCALFPRCLAGSSDCCWWMCCTLWQKRWAVRCPPSAALRISPSVTSLRLVAMRKSVALCFCLCTFLLITLSLLPLLVLFLCFFNFLLIADLPLSLAHIAKACG